MAARARRGLIRAVEALVLALVLAAGGVALANQRLISGLHGAWRLPASSIRGAFDTAIVPGCRAVSGTPVPMLAARLSTALDLYRAAQVRRILVTGNGHAGEPAAMK